MTLMKKTDACIKQEIKRGEKRKRERGKKKKDVEKK